MNPVGNTEKSHQQNFRVTGMSCSACSARVERAVGQLPGVKLVQVNLLTGSMQVHYQEPQNPASIIAAVVAAGYGASIGHAEKTPRHENAVLLTWQLTTIVV